MHVEGGRGNRKTRGSDGGVGMGERENYEEKVSAVRWVLRICLDGERRGRKHGDIRRERKEEENAEMLEGKATR